MTDRGPSNALANGQGREFLSIRISEQAFALDIMSVREIRGWVASTDLPHAPPYIKGMINLRGAVIAILDLAERLGLGAREPDASSVVVVIEAADRVVGLLVDAVCDIITVTDESVQQTPDVGSDHARDFIEGLVTIDGGIVSIVSIAAVMPQAFLIPAALAA